MGKKRNRHSPEIEAKINALRVGTFEERTKMIEDYIAKLDERIAAKKANSDS